MFQPRSAYASLASAALELYSIAPGTARPLAQFTANNPFNRQASIKLAYFHKEITEVH